VNLAGAAPVPVSAAVGAGCRNAVEDLALNPDVTFVDSPRHASVLLVAGVMPPDVHEALRRIHDQVAHPRRRSGGVPPARPWTRADRGDGPAR
jgi:hypothetical protein